jgi:SAM-dependent methyltransferase
MTSKKLNLGCGQDYREGWINVDISATVGADVVHDICKLPLPFADNQFDEILCNDILEHVEYTPVLKDLHRILAPGGAVHIRVPHFTSKNNFIDPTHIKQFSIQLFDFFVKDSNLHKRHRYQFEWLFSASPHKKITFEKTARVLFYNKYFEHFVNKTPRRQWHYEVSFLRALFPAENILVTLIK